MSAGDWLTLRELDQRQGLAKGTTFRSFRKLEPRLVEGRDYRVLHASRDAGEITALRQGGRIYPSSVNVVLLSAALAARIASGRG